MCKTVETSLTTYAISFVCVCVCLQLAGQSAGIRFACLFIMSFSTMQLLDAGLWWSIDNRAKSLNHIITRYAIPVVLASEVLVSYFAVKYIFGWKNAYYELGLAIFVAFILGGWWFKYCTKHMYTAPHPTEKYLHWCGTEFNALTRALFLFFLLAPVLLGMPKNETAIKYVLAIPITTTLLVNFNKITFGSRWCWSSNITSIILTAYAVYIRYFK